MTLAERWNGRKWKIQHTPNPAGAAQSVLNGVSCVSANACIAVGLSSHGARDVTLAERWNGRKWRIQPTRNPSQSESSGLFGVSCTSKSACTAVGGSDTPNVYYSAVTLAERWNGSSWTIQATPGSNSSLDGVSCRSVRVCTAVGWDGVGTLAERWDGTGWTIQSTPSRPTGSSTSDYAPGNWLSTVSCPSVQACIAVGGSDLIGSNTGYNYTLAEHWDGTQWTIKPTGNLDQASLNGVSCISANACTAVGGNGEPMVERWNGTSWKTQSTPARVVSGQFNAVSCPSRHNCIAVGGASTSQSVRALAERWTG